jgi:hypothetical protein
MSDDEGGAYQRYRYFVISKLSKLELLDAMPVSHEERAHCDSRATIMTVARPIYKESDAKVDPRSYQNTSSASFGGNAGA